MIAQIERDARGKYHRCIGSAQPPGSCAVYTLRRFPVMVNHAPDGHTRRPSIAVATTPERSFYTQSVEA